MRRRTPRNGQIAALEKIASEYEQRQSTLFMQFHETWRGMTMGEFRASLKAMVSRVKKKKESFSVDQTGDEEIVQYRAREQAGAESFSVDQTGDEARAKTVVDVDDGDV
jgi:hypothetical protein